MVKLYSGKVSRKVIKHVVSLMVFKRNDDEKKIVKLKDMK